ncbi:MAG: peptide deformylase [Desulfobulbaceae bacterium]|nr:peptide deformylase [Desulfobulbaceae bacterium]
MALREILTYPNPILRQNAEPVTDFDESLRKLVNDMAETMYDAPGVGLAANQIGVVQQIVVIDASEEKNDLMALINPEILSGEGSQVDEEGCLSVVGLSAKVKRFNKIKVKAFDVEGKEIEFEAEEWFARVVQHEVDHLKGTLFIDHLSSLKRSLYKKKRKKQLKEEQAAKNDKQDK